ncbi:Hypothetical protein SRAE_2000194500 [Strongyloides ratti]|uniref:Uncharacterized protein n=1 Tax=Strongyloides ratti TaxID=34506 RepID=A0A090LBX6_STRRB|nr:Hypothetical protein SRAE_2000194500 [Strongyloides ratti]CEF67281.1 Hypothetical protein SRAE_2000194500 [Strongyloides ratti]
MKNMKNQKKRNRRNNAYGARNVTDNDFVNEPTKEFQTSLLSSNQVSTDSTVKNYSRHDLHKIRFHLGLKKQEAIQSGTWDTNKDVYDPDEVNEACVKLDEDKKRKETENAERRKRRYNLSKKTSNDESGEGRDRKEIKISNNQSQKSEDPYKDLSKLQKKIKRQNDGKMAMHDPFYYNEAMKKISIIIGEDIQQKFSLHKGMLIELEELLNQYGNDQKTFIEKLEQSWGSHFEFMTQLVSMLLDESNLSEEMCTNPTRIVQINALEIIIMIYIYCRHSGGKISAKNVFRTIEKEFQREGNELTIGMRLLEIFKKETPLYNYLKKFVQLDIENEDISDEEEFIDGTGGDVDFSSDDNQVLYV